MQIIEQSWSFESDVDGIAMLEKIEKAGRTCYKSEGNITVTSTAKFCGALIRSGHHSVLEHESVSVRIVTNRGVSHEIVRHRLASYSQESTRYCNYKDVMGFIRPVWWSEMSPLQQKHWILGRERNEQEYLEDLKSGLRPEQARDCLPNALKTEIVMTCNIREWRHFFSLRCSKKAHPQMRALALDMLATFYTDIPILFDDIAIEYLDANFVSRVQGRTA